jgi:hypothetical protein
MSVKPFRSIYSYFVGFSPQLLSTASATEIKQPCYVYLLLTFTYLAQILLATRSRVTTHRDQIADLLVSFDGTSRGCGSRYNIERVARSAPKAQLTTEPDLYEFSYIE